MASSVCKRISIFLVIVFFGYLPSNAQNDIKKPKLIIGLVIDQMRWDYLYRFNGLYGNGGFKRLLGQGFSCENTFCPYIPTYTAPGHTCIYTGSVPAFHGIIGNNWFDRSANKTVYCTDDSAVLSVGINTNAGKMSPARLEVTTITDELRLSNNFKSKVIGIALKDRAAILPVGHTANAAYWYDGGKWISSSYYMKTLPVWVDHFNNEGLPSKYLDKGWSTLYPMDKYIQSSKDNEPYENHIKGEATTTFPHSFPSSATERFEAFRTSPFANTYTFDMAKAAIDNEKLGSNTATDFLAISISSTDYIGHTFGPNSVEIEDTYLRLDADIAGFLNYLDNKFGKNNYLLFLSADHGVAHIPEFLEENRIDAGTFNDGELTKEISNQVEKQFNLRNSISSIQNYQVYLNMEEIAKQGKNSKDITQFIIRLLKQKPYIQSVFETENTFMTSLPEPVKQRIINAFNPKRSGDIQFTFLPAYFDFAGKGTSHGAWYPYDSHIPLVWFGWNIPHGFSNREIYMTDIAPTIAALMHIQMPSGSVGHVIQEVVK